MQPFIIKSKDRGEKFLVLNSSGQLYLIADILMGTLKFISYDELESNYKFIKPLNGIISTEKLG